MLLFLELAERDYRILATLYLLRISTALQLNTLYFSSERTARERLFQLKDSQYIDIVTLSDGKYRRINVYYLTRKGAYEARNWLDRYDRKLPKLNVMIHPRMFKHELLMVDVFAKLVQEEVVSVEDLFSGNFMDSRLAPVLPCVFKKKAALKADARFRCSGINFWLEVDRGTEHMGTIKEKLMSYQTYFAANPGERHIVLFLIDGDVDWKRIHKIRALSCEYIGPHNNGGKINWYTCPFTDLEFIVKRLIQPRFFKDCINGLIKIGLYKGSMRNRLAIFDYTFLPTANMPAAWLGLKDLDSDYEQFYIVESIVGGESGALQRLQYFKIQLSEFYHKNGGRKIKLILLINGPEDLVVITELYPSLINDLIAVPVNELLDGQSKVLIGREEHNA